MASCRSLQFLFHGTLPRFVTRQPITEIFRHGSHCLVCSSRHRFFTTSPSSLTAKGLGSASVKKGPRTAAPRRAALTLTPAAVQRIRELCEQQEGVLGVKIGVKQRGCNGLSYTLDYALEKGRFDEVVEQDGARVLIDAKAQLTLLGTEMDFQKTKLSSEFIFINPNIKDLIPCDPIRSHPISCDPIRSLQIPSDPMRSLPIPSDPILFLKFFLMIS
ncbi:unnamed protein product [Cyprideis torosa]|uniref:Iron-sulfur cluster assembly 1 homolog, mitochondrial n=1 Tax=Cyprideis torosa TaxID=163714 RepID=A0A7R8ZLG6_9CRUS|nr:unnamed protein product [Cyprideis torosa]CAG0883644.1 unnamed protein product [Cyprideis torosa]